MSENGNNHIVVNRHIVSVIVPVYNVEKYLHRCVDSIINQTYENIEIILVDDGSQDNSGKICDEYAKKDERIRIIHKENGGVSSARNAALDIMSGEFAMFVDSDDYIVSDCIETLINRQNAGDFDMVLGKSMILTKKNNIIPEFSEVHFFAQEIKENIFYILKLYSMVVPWAKLYKTDIIKSNNLYFRKNISLGEDSIFVMEYMENIHSFSSVDIVVYNYNLKNDMSATKKYHKGYNENSKILIDVLKRIIDYSQSKENKEFNDYIVRKIRLILEHYLYQSPGFNTTVLDVKNTIDIFKDDIEFDLFESIYSRKLIEYLKKGEYRKFVYSWKIANCIKLYGFKTKNLIKKIIYKVKSWKK